MDNDAVVSLVVVQQRLVGCLVTVVGQDEDDVESFVAVQGVCVATADDLKPVVVQAVAVTVAEQSVSHESEVAAP